MDWLKDKKNQPIVALILAVVIVGVGFFVWKMVSPGSPTEVAQSAEPTPMDGPDYGPNGPPDMNGAPPPGQPGQPGQPDMQGPQGPQGAQAPAGGDQLAMSPMETWRADPFLPVGYKPPPKSQPKPKPRIVDFPFIRLPVQLPKDDEEILAPEPIQPPRRMAGVLLNDRVYAIIETNGQSQIVQPGDVLSDRLARVEKIEPDKVTLKTLTAKPKYLVVRMASSSRVTSTTPTGDTTVPTMPRGPIGMPPRDGVMAAPTPPM